MRSVLLAAAAGLPARLQAAIAGRAARSAMPGPGLAVGELNFDAELTLCHGMLLPAALDITSHDNNGVAMNVTGRLMEGELAARLWRLRPTCVHYATSAGTAPPSSLTP